MRPTTRRELVVAATAASLSAAVPPAWGRLTSRRARMGAGRFADGVASGEPSAGAVTFWSRLRTDHPRSGARLVVAADPGMDRVVATTVVPTGSGVNWSLKARVGGLEPHTEYWYQWHTKTASSPVGRTRTVLPADSRAPVRLAFSSCQRYENGFFAAHRHAAAEELDLYAFLGDYVYEYGGEVAGAVREDGIAAVDLATYRAKYQRYRGDAGLRELHRQHPVVHIWDDHEVFNNYSQTRPALAQRWAGYRAAFEWMPRMVLPAERFRVYGRQSLGGLVDLFLLDERQYRDSGHIIDPAQMDWLLAGLASSTARWKLVANQVAITHDPAGTGGAGAADQWDGYPADRARLLSAIEQAGIRDVVFLTGDLHVFLCSLLGTDFAALADPARVPAGVEYLGGSVTSPGRVKAEAAVRQRSPWIQQYEGALKGYTLMAADEAQLVTEYRASDLRAPGGATQTFETFVQPAGTNRVQRSSARSAIESTTRDAL